LVWSGFKPHRVVSCGLPVAASTMQFAPCSPSLFLSRLRARKPRRVPRQSVRGSTALGGADGVNHSQLNGQKELSGKLGSLLDASERRINLEHVRKVLGALRSEIVPFYTENNGNLALVGADSVNCSQLCACTSLT
jgi:hypothetical protein